ncbi:GNAT family N-acetyltransferase [Actinomycetes bacterium KLBMP 9797]
MRFRQAGVDQAAEVLGVLDEAADWLARRGISQWPARFELPWIEQAITRGETWLVEVDDRIAGTVTLDWSDPLWDGVDGAAGYAHRIAVRRRAAGLGAVILDWAARTVREHERNALRLDCVATNRGLRSYYEAAGFVHRGDVTVGGAPGQRLGEGPVTVVSRYEKPLTTESW